LIPRRWWPPVIWLGAILTATSLPGSFLPAAHFRFADKAAHFAMYAGLGLLLARAMHDPPRTTRFRVILAAFLMVAAVGALDEWHQRYMQQRSTEFADWMADSAGGLIGALIWVGAERAKATRTA
jgi:VanZ family protein